MAVLGLFEESVRFEIKFCLTWEKDGSFSTIINSVRLIANLLCRLINLSLFLMVAM